MKNINYKINKNVVIVSIAILTLLILFNQCVKTSEAYEEVCFSPSTCCEDVITKLIDESKKEIYIAIYSFNNDKIYNSLVKAHNRGIKIFVIYDNTQSKQKNSKIQSLKDIGIEMYPNFSTKIEHNKFIIIDGEFMVTGSFNFTNAATHVNSENCIMIDKISVVDQYRNRFQFLLNKYKNR